MEHLQTSAATTGNKWCGYTLLVHLSTQHCKKLWGMLFLNNNNKYWTEQSAYLYCISSNFGREIYQKYFYLHFKKQERWKDQRAFVQDQLLTHLIDLPLFGSQLVQQNDIRPTYAWTALQEQQQKSCCSRWRHNRNQGSLLSSQGTPHKIRNPVPRASDLNAIRAWGRRGSWRRSICIEGPGSPVGPGPGRRTCEGQQRGQASSALCPRLPSGPLMPPLHAWAFRGKFSGGSLSTLAGVLLYRIDLCLSCTSKYFHHHKQHYVKTGKWRKEPSC